MRVLGIDLSTKTGHCHLEGEPGSLPELVSYGVICNDKPIKEFGEYPFCYLYATDNVIRRIRTLVMEVMPDVVVIEQSNKGKNRFTQKAIEFLHCKLLEMLDDFRGYCEANGFTVPKVVYINSSDWRSCLKVALSKEDKKNNAKIYKAKKLAAANGESIHSTKKKLGVKGKINKKHVAIRYVNATFHKDFKVKDNDICDAIALATSYFLGAKLDNGE